MSKRFARMKYQSAFHFMLLPAVIIVLIFSYGPMLGVVIAFQNYMPLKGFVHSDWVGLDNFKYMIGLADTYRVLGNTVFIAGMKIVAGLVFPVVLALLLNEVAHQRFKKSVQTLIYMPYFLSWIILGGILIEVLSLDGVINGFLKFIGIEPVMFLGNNHTFPYVLVVTDLWKNVGFGTVLFLAALTNIDPSLYEASAIDGASRWKQVWNITMPGILPIIILVATLSVGDILNAGFEQVFTLLNPIVYQSGDIIDTYVYRIGLIETRYSLATAVGLVKSVVAMILVGISYYAAYRFANYRIF